MEKINLRERPYTAGELFNEVTAKMKKEGLLPDILDYPLGNDDRYPACFTDVDWIVESSLNYGGSEGIYLDLWASGNIRKNQRANMKTTVPLGTFKTPYTSRSAMRDMGILLADFIVETSDFVRRNTHNFEFEGCKILLRNDDGNGYSSYAKTLEEAQKKAEEFRKKNQYPHIILLDLEKRTQTVY